MAITRIQAEATSASLVSMPLEQALRRGFETLNADFAELLLAPANDLVKKYPADARAFQFRGLVARSLGDGPLAYRSFRRAARLAPGDPLIAHSHARTALEAGHAAVSLFTKARQLAPNDGGILTGLSAALLAEGRAEDADTLLANSLRANPLWIDGHRALAQIRGQFGGDIVGPVRQALVASPREPILHALAIDLLLKARLAEAAVLACEAARAALGDYPWLSLLSAHAFSEAGDLRQAKDLFEQAGPFSSPGDAALAVRHLLRSGQPEQAIPLLDRWLPKDSDHVLVPYASVVWRMTGDPKAQWLEGDESLVGVYDLGGRIGDLGGLARRLRSLHAAISPPIDQSVRGGTQTDGNLLLRDEPALQRLRTVVLDTLRDHVSRLAPPRAGHATLLATRTPLRIAGSWSVRLRDAGFHSDHVHTQGWLSSALYISLPESIASGAPAPDHAGWLSLGECRDLVPDLPALRIIEPRPGRLVLFPSTMWHGTRPFPKGERLTIAFDIARPRQD